MKISDLLRDFADTHLLRSIADAVDQQNEIKTPNSSPIAVAPSLPITDAEPEDPPTDKFMPPLQLKLELEKRAAGIKSIYDENDTEDCEDDDEADALMLQQLKKNAGISNIMSKFSDDAPLGS
jgi:hypothetical protein